MACRLVGTKPLSKPGILSIGPLGTSFSEILIKIQTFWSRKMHLNMSPGKWRPFCLGFNVLNLHVCQSVEPSYKTDNAPVPYPTIHHSEQKYGALWDMREVHCGICELDHSLRIMTSRLRHNGRHFADDIFKCILLSKNDFISMEISLKFVSMGSVKKTRL